MVKWTRNEDDFSCWRWGNIPASYVSLPEGRFTLFGQHRLESEACNQQLCHGTQFFGTLKIETMPGEPQFVCQPNASWLSFPSWDVAPLLVTSFCSHCVPLIRLDDVNRFLNLSWDGFGNKIIENQWYIYIYIHRDAGIVKCLVSDVSIGIISVKWGWKIWSWRSWWTLKKKNCIQSGGCNHKTSDHQDCVTFLGFSLHLHLVDCYGKCRHGSYGYRTNLKYGPLLLGGWTLLNV